jgi:hypothetical protein
LYSTPGGVRDRAPARERRVLAGGLHLERQRLVSARPSRPAASSSGSLGDRRGGRERLDSAAGREAQRAEDRAQLAEDGLVLRTCAREIELEDRRVELRRRSRSG